MAAKCAVAGAAPADLAAGAACCTAAQPVVGAQGLTLVHLSAQRKHLLWDMLYGVSLTKTAQVELRGGRV